jgi:hypothetical protein
MKNLPMTKPIAGLLAFFVSSTLLAEAPASIPNVADAKGVRHSSSEYHPDAK